MKKILIFYLSESSGHHAAANAIEAGLKLYSGNNVQVRTINALNYLSPLLEKVVMKTYMGVVRGVPDIWDFIYENEKFQKRISRLREKAHKMNTPKFFELIIEEMPDTIVCTQAYACGVLNTFKEMYGFDFSLYGIITDYIVHPYWIYKNVDHYIVPSEEVKQKLIEKEIPENKIQCFGIPVRPHFSDIHNTKEIRKRYNIDDKAYVIMIMGGGLGLLPMKNIISKLDKVSLPLHIIAVSGKNRKLYGKLKAIEKNINHPLIVFGYVNNISEIMEISDLLISKPGGMTTSEALIKSLPMIIYKPLPGQESGNTEFLVRKNVAVKMGRIKDLPGLVEALLDNPDKLHEMRKNIEALRKPFPTLKIANHILGNCDVSLLEV